MPGIGVINNPHSRRNKKNPEWLTSLGYIVGTSGKSVATECIEDVHAMAQTFRAREIDILAINGGDGSNSVALTALIEAYQGTPLPKIALLRGGTMNIAANSCGVKGTPSGLMLNLVEKYRAGQPFQTTWRDTLEVEGRYGFVFGNGFIHSFLEKLYNDVTKSVWGASKLLGRGAASAMVQGPFAQELFAGVRARVTVDGQRLDRDFFPAMAAATVGQIGLNFKAFHRWDERPHSFHLLLVICSPTRFATALPKIYTGRQVAASKMLDMVASEVRLESDAPLAYTLDGENFHTGPRLRIGTGPRLEMIVS